MQNDISFKEQRKAVIEVAVFAILALASKWVLSLVMWRYAGPVSLFFLIGVITVYSRTQGRTWRDMGLKKLEGTRAKLMVFPQMLMVMAAFAAAVAITVFGGQAIGLEFMGAIPEGVEDRWGAIEGSLPHLLLWLGIVWTAAAFGEEMFFRGFMITRLQAALTGVPFASVFAVILAAAFFGYGHVYYQGLRGFITTGAIALAFGAMFLVFKRSLWPMIFFHGVIDTIGMVGLYFGTDL